MSEPLHVARVVVVFEFIGVLPIGSYADPEKAVRERFKFMNPEIHGFAEQRRQLNVIVQQMTAPPLPDNLDHEAGRGNNPPRVG
jgi:hypothetical protein